MTARDIGASDYSGMTTRRWLWPVLDLGVLALTLLSRITRWHAANLDARGGRHGNHTVCRHGRAVELGR